MADPITIDTPQGGPQNCATPLIASGSAADGVSVSTATLKNGTQTTTVNVAQDPFGNWTANFGNNVPCGVPLTITVNGTNSDGQPVSNHVDFSCNC
jgi:hypothetical protein